MFWFPENRSALGGWEYRRTKSSAQSSATGPRLKSFSPSPDERQHCDIICRCGKFNWISHFSSSCGLGPRRGLSSIFFPSTHKAQPTANNAQNGYCFPLFREGTGSIGNEKKKEKFLWLFSLQASIGWWERNESTECFRITRLGQAWQMIQNRLEFDPGVWWLLMKYWWCFSFMNYWEA